eukprot:11337935-Alexandrium_andersonii.AAC.1
MECPDRRFAPALSEHPGGSKLHLWEVCGTAPFSFLVCGVLAHCCARARAPSRRAEEGTGSGHQPNAERSKTKTRKH